MSSIQSVSSGNHTLTWESTFYSDQVSEKDAALLMHIRKREDAKMALSSLLGDKVIRHRE